MNRVLSRAVLGFFIIAGLLAAGSCGSETPATTTTTILTTAPITTVSPTATVMPTTTVAPTTTMSPTATGMPTTTQSPGAAAAVAITNYAYIPSALTVSAGTTVTWTNNDNDSHTVTSRTSLFDSGLFGKDKSFSYTFSQKGEYEYYCIPHPYMTGKVIVE